VVPRPELPLHAEPDPGLRVQMPRDRRRCLPLRCAGG